MILWMQTVKPREDCGGTGKWLRGVVVECFCKLFGGDTVDGWRIAQFGVCGRRVQQRR
jgi:hypothetical protein